MEKRFWRKKINCTWAWTWAIDPVRMGEKLSRIRKDYNFSQEDLVDFFDFVGVEVTKQAISNWETGKSVPRLDKLIVLADGLYKVSLDELCIRCGREERTRDDEQLVPPFSYTGLPRGRCPLSLTDSRHASGVRLRLPYLVFIDCPTNPEVPASFSQPRVSPDFVPQ